MEAFFWRYWPFVRGIHRSLVDSLTKACDAKLWCFLWFAFEHTIEYTIKTPLIWDAIAPVITSLSYQLFHCMDGTNRAWIGMHNSIAGTLGCVFIDNETHESGVTKCTTGEAWSAFSWHHSSVFHCQWIHNQVFLLLSHMLTKNAKSIFIYVMKHVSGFIWKLGINLAVFIKWIDVTWWNNRLLLVPNCYEVVAMVATMVAMVAPLWCHTLR